MKGLEGQRFGRLMILRDSGMRRGGNIMYLCACDCGNEILTTLTHLKSGHTQSCGCLQKERTSAASKTHGMSNSRLYRIWANMKSRCLNPNVPCYVNYGARSIGVCEEWKNSFSKFEAWALSFGYDDSLTIDRIDSNLSYSPQNCRWVDDSTQRNNKRNNHLVTYLGTTLTCKQWSEKTGISDKTIRDRLNRYGWSPGRALGYE